MPVADHIAIKETGVMLAVRIVVGCEILKALDHLENVGLRILVQRRDALRNHGATSHTHRSPRNVVQRRDGGDLVSCRFHFPHSFRRSRCLRPAALTRWRSAGWGGGRSEEHTSELQSLMRHSSAVFCLKKKNITLTTLWKHDA